MTCSRYLVAEGFITFDSSGGFPGLLDYMYSLRAKMSSYCLARRNYERLTAKEDIYQMTSGSFQLCKFRFVNPKLHNQLRAFLPPAGRYYWGRCEVNKI